MSDEANAVDGSIPDPDPLVAARRATVGGPSRRALALLERPSLTPARIAAGGLVVLVALAAGWWLVRAPAAPVEASLPMARAAAASSTAPPPTGGSSTSGPSTVVVVHAAGAVARPGLYRLATGARVADLLTAAGGAAAGADGDRLNLAAPLVDGERVYVPKVGEDSVPPVMDDGNPAPSPGSNATGTAPAEPVDLNRATLEQLDTLPGIGPATAQAILDYRTEHGSFASIDELLEVRGIGDAKLAELHDRVRV